MKFTYIITKNNQTVAGFTNYMDACNYKVLMTNLNRASGYKDRYKIVDRWIEKHTSNTTLA